MKEYYTPNDDEIMGSSDSESIQNAVDEALKTGIGKVVIPKLNKRTGKALWEVDSAVILSSNIEIILDNAYILQKEGSMDNVFRNFEEDKIRKSYKEEQHNIIIRGMGNAVIDGGKHNGLTEFTSMKNGMPNIRKNNMILLHNLRNFTIEGITLLNQRWWAVNLIYCEQGIVSRLNINAQNNVPNQDGVDLRIGCHDIIIENLSGQSGDDFIALTGFYGGYEAGTYTVEGKSKDIHDIIIKNIIASSFDCAVVALRNNDGVKLYNVSIDNIHDTANGTENMTDYNVQHRQECRDDAGMLSPYAVVRINQKGFESIRSVMPGETYGINITNIYSKCNAAVMINRDIEKTYIGNIYANGKTKYAVTTKTEWGNNFGLNARDVIIENVFFNAESENSVVFDFDNDEEDKTLENVYARNIFCGNAKVAVNLQHKGRLVIDNMIYNGEISKTDGSELVINGKTIL